MPLRIAVQLLPKRPIGGYRGVALVAGEGCQPSLSVENISDVNPEYPPTKEFELVITSRHSVS